MRTIATALSLALLLGLSTAASAQETDKTWYEVEIIVFEQREPQGPDAEQLAVNPPEPDYQAARQLAPATGAMTAFSQLPDSQLRLGGVLQVLEKSGNYRPLLHFGWRQPGLGQQQAQAVVVPAQWQPGEQQAPQLHGLVRLIRERFLHVAVDLRYLSEAPVETTQTEPGYDGYAGGSAESMPPAAAADTGGERAIATAEQPAGGDNLTSDGFAVNGTSLDSAWQPAPVYVHLHQQSRRMRSGELHYLDHPVLGVLVQVTPIEPAAQ